MNRTKICAVLAVGMLLAAGGFAQERRAGFRHRPGVGRGYYYPYGYSFGPRFGWGLGFGFGATARRSTAYRNALTADVAYAESTMNGFRAAYEKQKGDPLGIKADVQRLDEGLEGLRREAEAYGAVTIRGTELLRTARSRADAIDERLRPDGGELSERWSRVQNLLQSLSRTYRI